MLKCDSTFKKRTMFYFWYKFSCMQIFLLWGGFPVAVQLFQLYGRDLKTSLHSLYLLPPIPCCGSHGIFKANKVLFQAVENSFVITFSQLHVDVHGCFSLVLQCRIKNSPGWLLRKGISYLWALLFDINKIALLLGVNSEL